MKKTKKEIELIQILKQVQADFENYKKRVERDQQAMICNANKSLICELLPVLDSFELALKNCDEKEFKSGVELIYAQFIQVLEEQGIKKMETKGKFDPYKHEALLTEPGKDGQILEVFQHGYMLNETIIRPAKVKVAKEVKNAR